MKPADRNWRDEAYEVYRLAWAELLTLSSLRRPNLEYYVEELKEALLDLKQATIDDEPIRAAEAISEIWLLVAEIRSSGD